MLQLEKREIDSLANKTIVLDDAGVYRNLKTRVEELFRLGRHYKIQVLYLAHYAKDVLLCVSKNCFRIFRTIKNSDSFFETITNTYSIKELNWKQYRDQLENDIVEYDSRSQKYKILIQKYQVVYDTTKIKESRGVFVL